MGEDYDEICRTTQQNIERDRGRAAELLAGAEEKQRLLDAYKQIQVQEAEWKSKYEAERRERMRLQEEVYRLQQIIENTPRYQFSHCDISELIQGDKHNHYVEADSIQGMPDKRVSIG